MTEPGETIDTAALESRLAAELGTDVVGTEVLHDGLNLSIAVTTETEGRAYVVRRPNKFRDRESFNDIAAEHAVLERLQETPVPAPEPVSLCEDESVLGGPFLVETCLEWEPVPLGSALPERFRTPAAREAFAVRLVETLADLHSVDAERFTEVCDRRPVREHVDRLTAQLDDAVAVTGHEFPPLFKLADWLRANVPSDAGTALVHGDYRPANVLFMGADRPNVAGVLDWETAFLGDPLTELGYLLLRWRDSGDTTPPLDGIRSRHDDEAALRDLQRIDDRGLAPFTNEPGSPTRRDLVARHEDLTGVEFDHDRFYRAFGAFVLATVWEDLDRHRIEQGGSTEQAPYVEYLALLADGIVNGELES